jgi:group I intron endonuclease
MENVKVYIYGLIDPINNEIRYVGKSVNPIMRLRKHISERFKHDSYKDRWIRKIISNDTKPEIIIIDEVLNDNWCFWEQFYISYFKMVGARLTNSTIGGDQPPSTKGRKHSDETKKKMSQNKSGKPIPWLNEKPRSVEHQNNLTKSLKGKKSEKTGKTYEEIYGVNEGIKLKVKLSEAHKGKYSGDKHPMYGKEHNKETKNKIAKALHKEVIQLDLDGNIIKIWESIKEAQIGVNIKSGITKVCNDKQKTAGNYKWEYKN